MKCSPQIVLCFLLFGCSNLQTPTQVRVQNLTGHDLSEVTVITTVATNAFGAMKFGATSKYQTVQVVFEDASIFTSEPNGYFRNHRIGGRNPTVPNGSYTYVLQIDTNNMLEITLKKDR